MVAFWPFFAEKEGGVSAESKKYLSEKTEVVKKGEGGDLSFLTKRKKNSFLRLP